MPGTMGMTVGVVVVMAVVIPTRNLAVVSSTEGLVIKVAGSLSVYSTVDGRMVGYHSLPSWKGKSHLVRHRKQGFWGYLSWGKKSCSVHYRRKGCRV